MDESKDVGGGRDLESSVPVSAPGSAQVLVEKLGGETLIEDSFSEGEVEEGNEEDIMVGVVGSDVFVDGVSGNSNDEPGWGGLVVEGALEKDMKLLDGDGDEADDLASQETGVLNSEVWDQGIGTRVGGSSMGASSLGGEGQVAVAEQVVAGLVSEEDLKRGRKFVDGGVNVVPGEGLDDKAQTSRGSIAVQESFGEETQVVVKEVAVVVGEEETDRVLVGKEKSVYRKEEAVDDFVSQQGDVLDKVWDPVTETSIASSSAVAEPSSVAAQVVNEAAMMPPEEVLNPKIEVSGGDTFATDLPCSQRGQISTEDVVSRGKEKDGGVCAGSGLSDEEAQAVVGGEIAEQSLSSKVETTETDAFDRSLRCVEEEQKLKATTLGGTTESDSLMSFCQPTEVSGGEVAIMDNKILVNPQVDAPNAASLNKTISSSENDQKLTVETVSTNTEDIACSAGICLTNAKEVLDSKDSAMVNDAFDENLQRTSEHQQLKVEMVDKGTECPGDACTSPDECTRAAERGDVSPMDNENTLNSKIEVQGSEKVDGKYSEKDQDLEVARGSGSTKNNVALCVDLASSGEQGQVIGAEISQLENKVISNSAIEVSDTDSINRIPACSENSQSLKTKTACGGAVADNMILADPESSDGRTHVASGEEVAARDIKEAALNGAEFSGTDALIGNICSVKEQELVGGSSEIFVDARGEQVHVAAEVDITEIDHVEVSNPEIVAQNGKLPCSSYVASADPESISEQSSEITVGEDTVVGDETVLDGNSSFSGNQKSEETDSGSREKGVLQADTGSFFEGTRAVHEQEVVAMGSVEVLHSEAEDIGVDAMDEDLCGPGKDAVGHADPESGCKQSLVGEGDSAAMEKENNSDSYIEVPRCDVLDRNLSLSEKDEELKMESGIEGAKIDADAHVGPSVPGTISDSLEMHNTIQDEKPKMVVQSDETTTHEVDGDQSVNPCTVENMSNQVSCITAISNSVVEVPVGSQGAVDISSSHHECDTFSCSTDITSALPKGVQGPEVLVVSNNDTLPDGEDTMCGHASDFVISLEMVNQAVEAKDGSFYMDENNIGDTCLPDSKVSEFGDRETIMGSLVVDLDACTRKDGNWNLRGNISRENIHSLDKSHHEGVDIQEIRDNLSFETSECLQDCTAYYPTQLVSDVGQETDILQATDGEQVCLHGGQEMEAEEQGTDNENQRSLEEKIVKRATLKPVSIAKGHQATYQLPPESEGEFSVSDLVWGKVRSHPWWPGQIFDPSDASEKAMRYHKKDCFLVAYFGDRTFAWNEASLLKPFRTHFSQIVKQSNSEVFHNAVDCALDEVSRRVEFGLACSCIPKDDYDEIKSQLVENTGIRAESSRRDDVDKSATASLFEPDRFVEYIKTLAQFPYGGADQLELVIAKAQLLAFSRLKGYHRLPEFQYCGGLLDNDADISCSKEMIEHETFVLMDDDGKLKIQNGSSHKRKHNLKDSPYPRKKERSLSELMGGMAYSPEDENDSDGKGTSKLVSSSGKKRKVVDSLVNDSVVQDRTENIFVAKVSSAIAPSPRQSFKVGDCIRRAASQLTGSPSILKCSGERPHKVDGSSGKLGGPGSDVSFLSPEDSYAGRMVVPMEYPSLDEMLSQLRLAARDPMKGYSFLETITSFFSEFRNSILVGQYSGKESSAMDRVAGGRKRKSSHPVGSPEEFEFEDMNDTYWTDRVIQNTSEEQPEQPEQPSRSGRKRKENQLMSNDPEKSLQSGRRTYSRKRYSDGNHELVAEKPTNCVDGRERESLPAELILNFSEVDSVPSEMILNKMFKRFGPLKESETEVDRVTSRARVVFKRCSDAEVAFSSAGMINIFGPTHVNYQLSYSPSTLFKALPIAIEQDQDGES